MKLNLLALSLLFTAAGAGISHSGQKGEAAKPGAKGESAKVVRIGAVASPGGVTVFRNLKTHLNRSGFPSDYVLYSTYDALIDALDRGEIGIAWNSPLAHAKYHIRKGGACQTLAMREGDQGLRQVLIVRKDSGIESLDDLAGKRLILDQSKYQHELLSVHYLRKEGVDFEELIMVDQDNRNPEHILKALAEGRADAAVIRESVWKRAEAFQKENPDVGKVWSSPAFNHCVFTASNNFDQKLGSQFRDIITTMDPDDPLIAELNRLEGTKKWIDGDSEGFESLVEAIRESEKKEARKKSR